MRTKHKPKIAPNVYCSVWGRAASGMFEVSTEKIGKPRDAKTLHVCDSAEMHALCGAAVFKLVRSPDTVSEAREAGLMCKKCRARDIERRRVKCVYSEDER